MNIGFHYYVTKTVAVRAGFSPREAQLIAYACQYVDDAQEHVKMRVLGMPEPTYERMGRNWFDPTCTSHKGIGNILYNFSNIRKKILLPFHFIPEGWDEERKNFRYLTVEQAPFAIEMVKRGLEKLRTAENMRKGKLKGLIRLGIALHSYEDSFAHQGFSARNSRKDNGVSNPIILYNDRIQNMSLLVKLQGFLGYSIGHGLLYTYPDRFNTRISYVNGRKKLIYVNTEERFLRAARGVYDLLRGYTGVADEWELTEEPLKRCLQWDWKKRSEWSRAFRKEFAGMNYQYSPATWKNQAIRDEGDGVYRFIGDRKWFYFHEGAYGQRVAAGELLG